MEKRLKISDKSLLCSFKISELIAKKKNPHTIGEELILPACKEIVDVMFGKEAAEQISNIPLSNDTVHRRIITMSEDIVKNVNEILQKNKEFALQLDESTDVSGKSKLISFIRFVEWEKIEESKIHLSINQKTELKNIIYEHLLTLSRNLKSYFPSLPTTEIQWVVSLYGPCGEENIKNANLSSTEKEQLLEISSDTTLKSKFYMSENDSFWISLQNEYPEVSKKALQILLPFSTSYMCESAFSILEVTKTKKRSTLKDIESELRVSLSTIRPRIEDLCSIHQSQVSH
ncbi:hypothetical protein QTP88_019771 [Uroleucon formosanum]